ncbi:MAG: DEAD/DEAH box helicase [Bdellovibrionales bacterium GWB1_55_8]|nr:MAG: DEAD/DEAH box helicase [Bdellovibrionales bacterium GWB1_55_8]
MSSVSFNNLNLIAPILKAVQAEGYETPTPIQAQAIPRILAGRDLLACAQTGTGKTAAFALPILQLLAERGLPHGSSRGRPVRVLVLTPTRELASQIGESFTNYGRGLDIRNTVIFGGVGQNAQVNALRNGVDVLVATPGRLLDLMQQRLVRFDALETFVLDEADRMLDMGFIHDVKRVIAAIPKDRQTLFFSATMPPEISRLASQILTQPERIAVTPVASTAERISQALYHVSKNQKTSLLIHLLGDEAVTRSLVFTRTKRDANRVAESLTKAGIHSLAIHGNKSQGARERALDSIKKGTTRVLVATDIAARGIDIDGVSHVFNYDIPNVPESYVHRIGRTARAGAEGIAVSFCSSEERGFIADVERLIRKKVPVLATPDGLAVESKKSGRGGFSGWRQDSRAPRGNRSSNRPSNRPSHY